MPTPPSIDKVSPFLSWDIARSISAPWLENISVGTVLRLEPQQVLYRQGDRHDYFYLIRSGFVRTTVSRSNGSNLLLETFGYGAIFGEATAFVEQPRHLTATAVTAVVLSRYKSSDMLELFRQYPELSISLLKLLGIKHRLLIEKLAKITSSEPEERLVDFLARTCLVERASGSPTPRLTHEEIASMTALSRVTITRTLKILASKGLVVTRAKGVEIVDPDGLVKMLGSPL